MRVPQVKEGPASALRAVFAGIGQLLSISDKLRGKSAASPDPQTVVPAAAPPEAAATQTLTQEAVAPKTATPEAAVAETAAPETAATQTPVAEAEAAATPGGHVRLLQADEAPAAPADAAPAPAAAADGAPSAELPLANYDELTVPSLRARLRNLSADQLGQLIAYEKSHAGRADVITMFERRVAKLAEG
jgi:hypothetical protein